MWRGDGSVDWPTVDGIVQRARVEHRIRGNFHIFGIPIYQSPGGYEVVIEYAYEVKGVTHTSDRWSFGGGLLCPEVEVAEAKARQYRESTRVTVHYDPNDPSVATLKSGEHSGAMFGSLIGGGIFLYALWSILSQ